MPVLHSWGGMPNSWIMLGFEHGGQRTVYRCTPFDVSITRGAVDISSMGSPYMVQIPGGWDMELRASMHGGQQVIAATYAECLGLIAQGWRPDVPQDGRRDDWRPIPR